MKFYSIKFLPPQKNLHQIPHHDQDLIRYHYHVYLFCCRSFTVNSVFMWHQNHFCCCKLLFFWSFQFSISKSHFLLSKQFHRNALSSVIKLSLLVVVVVYKLISIVSIVKSFVATDLAIVQQSSIIRMKDEEHSPSEVSLDDRFPEAQIPIRDDNYEYLRDQSLSGIHEYEKISERFTEY